MNYRSAFHKKRATELMPILSMMFSSLLKRVMRQSLPIIDHLVFVVYKIMEKAIYIQLSIYVINGSIINDNSIIADLDAPLDTFYLTSLKSGVIPSSSMEKYEV